ncbi:hypothetical protein ACFP63_00705 [Oerskovia jenensis]|uniref:Peptidase inhibitor family I36 n=1 Tax=Oerskovia jenensis TaxID=162169 RepID=A0ABS2LF29_9CELL|nr:hypothetical protein [Oerskovia jenensis]MBM7479025.1 hypothetical protein [Oerskovia jenensis]
MKRTSRALAVLFVAAATMFATAAPSSAAEGCTAAPGGWGAQNCISVVGSGLNVAQAESSYLPGVGWNANICSRSHEFKYKKINTVSYAYRLSNPSGCVLNPLQVDVIWKAPGNMANGSDFCGRSKNDASSNTFSNYACVRISA